MKKKLLLSGVIVLVILGVIVFVNELMPKAKEGEKELQITIVDAMNEDEVLLDKVFYTDAETLYDFLLEEEELKTEFDMSGGFGAFIISMYGIEQGSMETGPWWLYSSETNETCKAAGYCPGVSSLVLELEDEFVFKYTDSY